MHFILTVALKEFHDGLRNRWVIAITLIFILLSIGLAYFGAAASGQVGFTPLSTMIVSLASLAVFIIPIIALMLAYDTLVGEKEQGTLLLLLTYPLSRSQLILGKFFGKTLIMALSTLIGFSSSALLIVFFADTIDNSALIYAFALFILSAILLGAVFIALAILISVMVSEKSRAAGLALIIWFVFVLIYDLSLLGILIVTKGAVGAGYFPYLLLMNPTDIFRLINLSGFEAAQVQAGLMSLSNAEILSPSFLLIALLVWIIVPLLIAIRLFKRQSL
jgi:Cu-processing system permease protein